MVCDLTKNQRKKEKCKKSWVNRGSFKLKDFKQTEVGRDCKEFESALLQLFLSKQLCTFLALIKMELQKELWLCSIWMSNMMSELIDYYYKMLK